MVAGASCGVPSASGCCCSPSIAVLRTPCAPRRRPRQTHEKGRRVRPTCARARTAHGPRAQHSCHRPSSLSPRPRSPQIRCACRQSWLLQARTSAQRRAAHAMSGPSTCTRLLLALLTIDPHGRCNTRKPARLSKAASCTAMAEEQADGLPQCLGPSTGPTADRPVDKCERAAPKQATAFFAHRGPGKGREASCQASNPRTGARLLASSSPASAAPLTARATLRAGHTSRITGQHLSALLVPRRTDQLARPWLLIQLHWPKSAVCVLRHISTGLASANPLPSPPCSTCCTTV
jgi:hypothetical protein